MKQGQAQTDKSAGTKVEPVSRAVNPRYASDLGQQIVRTDGASGPEMYQGRGLMAPMRSQKTHKGGSQGNY